MKNSSNRPHNYLSFIIQYGNSEYFDVWFNKVYK